MGPESAPSQNIGSIPWLRDRPSTRLGGAQLAASVAPHPGIRRSIPKRPFVEESRLDSETEIASSVGGAGGTRPRRIQPPARDLYADSSGSTLYVSKGGGCTHLESYCCGSGRQPRLAGVRRDVLGHLRWLGLQDTVARSRGRAVPSNSANVGTTTSTSTSLGPFALLRLAHSFRCSKARSPDWPACRPWNRGPTQCPSPARSRRQSMQRRSE